MTDNNIVLLLLHVSQIVDVGISNKNKKNLYKADKKIIFDIFNQ